MNGTTTAAVGQPKIPTPFGATPAWILKKRILAGAKVLFAQMAAIADFKTWTLHKVSLGRLAGYLDVSIKTVKNYLGRLRDIGAVSWKRGGFGLTNVYTLHFRRRLTQLEIPFDDVEPAQCVESVATTREIAPSTIDPSESRADVADESVPVSVGETANVAKGNVRCRESAPPVQPVQNLHQKNGGTPAPGSSNSSAPKPMRFARQFVGGVKKATKRAGIKPISIRRKDLETIATLFREYSEPAQHWFDVWEFWWQRRRTVNSWKGGCLINAAQFAHGLAGLTTDAYLQPDWHQWLADRRRKAVARV